MVGLRQNGAARGQLLSYYVIYAKHLPLLFTAYASRADDAAWDLYSPLGKLSHVSILPRNAYSSHHQYQLLCLISQSKWL